MTIMQECVDDIKNIYGKVYTVNTIPINDVETYNYISKGNTSGVFQLESPGMTSFIQKLFQDVTSKINKIDKMPITDTAKVIEYKKFGDELYERLIAGVALYRPGPMDSIPKYIEGMLNPKSIHYDTPELQSILDVTYGILVYQEQVMQTVRKLAGFTKGQADVIRKAMGKKKEAILHEYEPYFVNGSGDTLDVHTGKPFNIKGCIANGIKESVAKGIWNGMYSFASYAFNKSHAAAYAVVASRTGFLQCHYPIIAIKATMNTYIGNADKLKYYLDACRRNNVKIMSPDINESKEMFSVVGKEEAIRFGLKGIKNLNKESILILKERKERGNFIDYQDFVERMVTYQKLSNKDIVSLIYAGALDSFPGTRKAKISIVDLLIKESKFYKNNKLNGQISFFDIAKQNGIEDVMAVNKISTPDIPEFSKDFKLAKEKEITDFYISEHPLDDYEETLEEEKVINISLLTKSSSDNSDVGELEGEPDDEEKDDIFGKEDAISQYLDKKIKVAGIISNVNIKFTRNHEMFYTFDVEDKLSTIKMVCFPKNVEKNIEYIKGGNKVIVSGKFQVNDFGPQIIVYTMKPLLKSYKTAHNITITGDKNKVKARNQWRELQKIVKKNNGITKIKFIVDDKDFEFPDSVELSLDVLDKIQKIFGENNCEIA